MRALRAALVFFFAREAADAPAKRARGRESAGELLRGVAQAGRTPAFVRIFVLQLASYPAFAAILGLWSGPWLANVYGMPVEERGELLLAMGAGHAGAATLHAARPQDVPVRVVALAGAAGIDPATALLQLRTAVDVVVPVERGPDGRRRVAGLWGWGAGPGDVPALVRMVDAGGTLISPALRRTTSSSTLSRCSASTETCCFSQATLVIRLPSRACRKKVRSPGCPTVPATNRSGAS